MLELVMQHVQRKSVDFFVVTLQQTQKSLAEYDWYHGDIDRETAEAKLLANFQVRNYLTFDA